MEKKIILLINFHSSKSIVFMKSLYILLYKHIFKINKRILTRILICRRFNRFRMSFSASLMSEIDIPVIFGNPVR